MPVIRVPEVTERVPVWATGTDICVCGRFVGRCLSHGADRGGVLRRVVSTRTPGSAVAGKPALGNLLWAREDG